MFVKKLLLLISICALAVQCTAGSYEQSNKICYLLLHSRLYRESNQTHHRIITCTNGNIIKALTIHNVDTLEPMITVAGNDIDAMVANLAGVDSSGDNLTYVPDYDYCSYLRIKKSTNKMGANQLEKQIISGYDSLHRQS